MSGLDSQKTMIYIFLSMYNPLYIFIQKYYLDMNGDAEKILWNGT